MGELSWSTLLVLAVTAAIAPFGLIAFSLVLATDRGTRNGVAFILGWIATVVLICGACLAVGGAVEVNQGGTSGEVTLGIQIGLGAVLIMLWIRRRVRARLGISDAEVPDPLDPVAVAEPEPEPEPDKPPPAWQRRIASMGVVGAFVLGGALQPWPIMIAGGAEIAQSKIGDATAIAVALLFAIGSAVGIIVLEVLALRSPGSAAARLDRIRAYVDHHRDSVISWALLIGGLWMIGRGIYGLLV